MEPRNIFISVQHYSKATKWERINPESEWLHIGTGSDIDEERLQHFIATHFAEDKVFIVLGKNSASEVETVQTAKWIIRNKDIEDIMICNLSYTKFIQYNKIGVVRYGTRGV